MRTVNKHISNKEFKNIYLLFGEENFLKNMYKNKLKSAIIPDEDTMNYHYYEGTKINYKEVIDLAETMPFFTDKRLIILENTGAFKSANEDLLKYIDKIPETTYFIFVENEVDKRGKMYKKVKDIGYPCVLDRQNNSILSKWMLDMIDKDGKKITNATMSYLIDYIGDDMEMIYLEVNKLLCYIMDKEVIEKEDIDDICTGQVTGKIFEMIDAMGNNNQKKALELYYDLIATKEPPMRILFMLSRQFNIMLQVSDQVSIGKGKDKIAEKMGVKPFIVSKVMSQLKNFDGNLIKEAINECINIESAIKAGKLEDKIAVELILIKYSAQG